MPAPSVKSTISGIRSGCFTGDDLVGGLQAGGEGCLAADGDVSRRPARQFPGHIVCGGRSRSEIVLPVMKGDQVIAVLDVDSDKLAQFDADDVAPLTKILSLLQPYL